MAPRRRGHFPPARQSSQQQSGASPPMSTDVAHRSKSPRRGIPWTQSYDQSYDYVVIVAPFLLSSGVSTAASMSTRKLSHGISRSMASSGSALCTQRRQPHLRIEKLQLTHPCLPNHAIAHETRTGQSGRIFFEASSSRSCVDTLEYKAIEARSPDP